MKPVNFGSSSFYITGGGLPEGDYALEFMLQMWKGEKSTFEASLGVMVIAHNLKDTSEEPRTQFYSMGRNAHKSFTIDPDSNGKRLLPIPGAPVANLYKETDFDMLLDSFKSTGLSEGIFMDDISVLDGIHAHLHPVPESASRQAMKKQSTSEYDASANKGPKMVSICTEIIAKPWEGKGGVPKKGKGSSTASSKTTKKEEKVEKSENSRDIAEDALGEVLTQKDFKKGGKKVKIRVQALDIIEKKYDDDTATKVSDEIFDDENAYKDILEALGYTIKGADIVTA